MERAYKEASLARMLRLLQSVGIYRLDGTSAVETEMELYAEHFGALYEALDQLADNCFVDSVTPEGAARYRALYALPASIGGEALRTIVRRRMAVSNRDFTVEGVRRCMASGGFEVALREDFALRRVTVTVLSDLNAFGTRAEKESFLRECLPCHLEAVFLWPGDN